MRASLIAVRSISMQLAVAPRRKRKQRNTTDLGHRSTDILWTLEPLVSVSSIIPHTHECDLYDYDPDQIYIEAIGMGNRTCAHLAVTVAKIMVWPSRDFPGHSELDGNSCI